MSIFLDHTPFYGLYDWNSIVFPFPEMWNANWCIFSITNPLLTGLTAWLQRNNIITILRTDIILMLYRHRNSVEMMVGDCSTLVSLFIFGKNILLIVNVLQWIRLNPVNTRDFFFEVHHTTLRKYNMHLYWNSAQYRFHHIISVWAK